MSYQISSSLFNFEGPQEKAGKPAHSFEPSTSRTRKREAQSGATRTLEGPYRLTRGCSSVGRAPALQAGGRQFESVHLHQGEPRGTPNTGGRA